MIPVLPSAGLVYTGASMTDGLNIELDAPKKKRIRRQKYRFIGGGVRIIGDTRVKNGDTTLLLPKQVTREWERVGG